MAKEEDPRGYADEDWAEAAERRINENAAMVRTLKLAFSTKIRQAVEEEHIDESEALAGASTELERIARLEQEIEDERAFLRVRQMTIERPTAYTTKTTPTVETTTGVTRRKRASSPKRK